MNNAEANKLDSDNVLEVRAQDQAPQHQEDGADRDNCYALRRADRDSSRLKPLVDCAELPELAHSTEPEFGAQRNLVISTGCPHSGWDMALPVLLKTGLDSQSDTWTRRSDEFFQAAGIVDPLQVRRPLQLGSGMSESAALLLSEAPGETSLLVDSRSLWLLDFWASMFPQAQFLLFYTREETALAHAIQQGIDPYYFLEGWQAAASQLLQFQRRHRRRALLLDAEAAYQQPLEMIQICRRFGLALQPAAQGAMPALAPLAIERLLASRLLAARPGAATIQAELEASAQPLAAASLVASSQPTELFNDYLLRRGYERNLHHQLDAAVGKLMGVEQTREQQAREYRQLQALLEEAQQELTLRSRQEEDLRGSQEQQAAELAAARQSLKEQEHNIKRLEARQAELSDENGRLQWYLGERDAELGRLAEDAVRQDRRMSDLQGELGRRLDQFDQLSLELSVKQADIERLNWVMGERSAEQDRLLERLAAKERDIELLQGELQAHQALKAAVSESAQENELLLLQLHQVQEELETTCLQKQEMDKQHKEQTEQIKSEVEQLTQARDQQAKLASERQTQLEQAQQAHKTLEATVSESAQENELLLLQLHQVQEELETTYLQNQEMDKKHKEQTEQIKSQVEQLTKRGDEQAKLAADRQPQLEKAHQAQKTLEATGRQSVQENELLLLQLHQVQEELEITYLQNQEMDKKHKEQTKQVNSQVDQLSKARDQQTKLASERQAQLEQLRKEKAAECEKLQAKISQLTKRGDEQAKLAADRQTQLEKAQQAQQTLEATSGQSVQEKKQLLLQLHQVQEELETVFRQKQQLSQGCQTLVATSEEAAREKVQLLSELQRAQEELAHYSVKYQEQQRELLARDNEVEAHRQRLSKVKDTMSWKITAPMRAIARPFKKSNGDGEKIKQEIKLLQASGLFDERWYLAQYTDVAEQGGDPVEHYLRNGAAEGRNPSANFDTLFYLETYPDVAATGMNPLLHFVKFGSSEGRLAKQVER